MTAKTRNILIFSIVYLIISIAAFVLVMSQVNTVGSELESRVQVVANSYAKEIKYNELNELVENTATEREALKQYMLSEEDTILFLAEVEAVGKEQGTELVTDSLSVTQNSDGKDQLTMKLSIDGPEELVMKMLSILETLPYHSEVKDLSLSRGVQREGEDEAEIDANNVSLKVTIVLLLF